MSSLPWKLRQKQVTWLVKHRGAAADEPGQQGRPRPGRGRNIASSAARPALAVITTAWISGGRLLSVPRRPPAPEQPNAFRFASVSATFTRELSVPHTGMPASITADCASSATSGLGRLPEQLFGAPDGGTGTRQ